MCALNFFASGFKKSNYLSESIQSNYLLKLNSNTMKNFKPLFIAFSLLFIAFFSLQGQELTYGFTKDGNSYTAVAISDFTSNNVTISSAVFSFLLPEGTTTSPSVPNLPDAGSFINQTGVWQVQVLKPSDYENLGFDPSELEGNDVYLVVLHNAPSPVVTAGQAIPLFSFELPNACAEGHIEVLTNNSSIQQSIYNNLSANFNNQMSMSVDDASSEDIYSGNDQATYAYSCSDGSIDGVPEAIHDKVNTRLGQTITIDVLANDDFGLNGPGSGSIQITGAPQFGTATIDRGADLNDQSDDVIIYTPYFGFLGKDVLTYQICDADGDCAQAKVRIRVRLFSALEESAGTGFEANFDYTPNKVKSAPNPFRDITTLGFEITTPGPVSIHIFSSQGQLLQTFDGYYDAGKHQIELNATSWQTSGMIIYDVSTPDYKTRGKMIKIEE